VNGTLAFDKKNSLNAFNKSHPSCRAKLLQKKLIFSSREIINFKMGKIEQNDKSSKGAEI